MVIITPVPNAQRDVHARKTAEMDLIKAIQGANRVKTELTLCSILLRRSLRSSETWGSSGKRSGSVCTTWKSWYTVGAEKGMRPYTNVNRQTPSA